MLSHALIENVIKSQWQVIASTGDREHDLLQVVCWSYDGYWSGSLFYFSYLARIKQITGDERGPFGRLQILWLLMALHNEMSYSENKISSSIKLVGHLLSLSLSLA